CDLFVGRVRGAVDLDDRSRLEAGEVGDEAAEDNLGSEPETRDLLAPEALPEAALGARRIAPERSGARRQKVGHGATPPPCPAPTRGAGTRAPQLSGRSRRAAISSARALAWPISRRALPPAAGTSCRSSGGATLMSSAGWRGSQSGRGSGPTSIGR